jgi:hypothetical protein
MPQDDQLTAYDYESTLAESTARVVTDERARKRVALGLEPARPTAKETIQRPPSDDLPMWHWRWLAFLVAALALATLLLVVATLLNWPTNWQDLRAYWRDDALLSVTGETAGITVSYDLGEDSPYRRLMEMDFSSAASGLDEEALALQYEIWTDSDAGYYRMRVWPGNLAWSVLGKNCLGPYRIETSAAIAADAPSAYVGLLGRFQNTENFYLFTVDGQGNYQALAQVEGEWQTLQPWTPSSAIQTAGRPNKLSLQDDGRTLNFLSNDTLLFGISDLALPAGNTGLVAGSRQQVAELLFDWLRLYDLPCRVPQ